MSNEFRIIDRIHEADRTEHVWERLGAKWKCVICGKVSDTPESDAGPPQVMRSAEGEE